MFSLHFLQLDVFLSSMQYFAGISQELLYLTTFLPIMLSFIIYYLSFIISSYAVYTNVVRLVFVDFSRRYICFKLVLYTDSSVSVMAFVFSLVECKR